MRRTTAATVLALLVIALAVSTILQSTESPSAVPANASPDQFSALRALKHLETIARKPHPTGSEENQLVRQYLAREIRALGLEPQIQTTTAVRPWWYGSSAARLANLIVRLKGREEGKALLLVSHYDSAPGGSGAADDGAAVAAMLETLGILKSGPQLRNDVIFLFTDAEELGLLGAQAFVEQHPWAADVGMVCNFEARGTEGPVFMFETSSPNGRLLREFRRSVAHPVASSLSSEIYKRMPNTTDFTIFMQHGLPGLNFAFIHGGTAYHTAQDSLERLNLNSLQHMGEYVLGVARDFGDADLKSNWTQGEDAIYFNVMGSIFFSYPRSIVLPLAAFLFLGVIGTLISGFRRGKLSPGGLLIGIGVNILGSAAIGILLLLMNRLPFIRDYNFVLWNDWTSNSVNLLGMSLVAVGASVAISRFITRKLSADNMVASGLALWILLTVVISFVSPGASYLFSLPALFAFAIGFLRMKSRSRNTIPVALFIFLCLTAAVTTILWTPTLALIGVALGAQTSLLIGIFVSLILFGPLAAQMWLMHPQRRTWILPAVAVALGSIVLVYVNAASGYSTRNRRMDSIIYTMDSETGETSWFSFDNAPDAWTSQFLGKNPARENAPAFLGSFPVLNSSAPSVSLGGAGVEIVAEEGTSNIRVLEVRIEWPFKVHRALIFLHSPGGIRKVFVDGQEVRITEGAAGFAYSAPKTEGILLHVELAAASSLEVETVGQIYSLPPIADFSYGPRPADMMADYMRGRISDSTLVRSVTSLPMKISGETSAQPEKQVTKK